jgi:hypothetical protein
MAALCIFEVGRIEVVLGEIIYHSSLSPEKFVLEKKPDQKKYYYGISLEKGILRKVKRLYLTVL